MYTLETFGRGELWSANSSHPSLEQARSKLAELSQSPRHGGVRIISPDGIAVEGWQGMHAFGGSAHHEASPWQTWGAGETDPFQQSVAATGRAIAADDERRAPGSPVPGSLPQTPFTSRFIDLLSLAKARVSSGGSEFAVALTLASLVASIRARRVLEIGRFRGLSTIGICAGFVLLDEGWNEPREFHYRGDVEYGTLLGKHQRRVVSVEPYPLIETQAALEKAGIWSYVEHIEAKSDDAIVSGPFDLAFLDGRHDNEWVNRDVAKFAPMVRPGGYLLLHDVYMPGSDTLAAGKRLGWEHCVIDSGSCSMVALRKP